MNDNIEWPGVIYFLATLLYIVIIYGVKHVERRKTPKTILSEEAYLPLMARQKECSEYDIFGLACEDWRISKTRMEIDFKHYLKQGHLPYYVKDYVRRNRSDT